MKASPKRSRICNKLGLLMLMLMLIATGMAGCTPSSVTPQAPAGEQENTVASEDEVWDALACAYTYTFPLVIMDATQTITTNTETATGTSAPINQFLHTTSLMTAQDKVVVTPNVDTVYSQCWLDLSKDAIVFFKPDSGDRFCSAQLMDMYTNTAAVLGTAGSTQGEMIYLLTGPAFAGSIPEGMTQVEVPTNSAWMLIRTLIRDESDLSSVHALQSQMHLVPLTDYLANGFDYTPPKGSFSEDNVFVPIEHIMNMSPQAYFTRANELMLNNAPTTADAAALETMALVGVGPGLSFDESILGSNAAERWKDMLSALPEELLQNSTSFREELGVWECFGYPIGEFGQEYALRALIAINALGANPVSVAVYPKASTDEQGAPLTGAQSYRIHFEAGALPPVEEYGFWSITAYGDDNFLIDNELNRYALNDRSDLVYNADGSLDILLSSAPPQDAALLNNWLPIGEGGFHLHLRIYIPSPSVLDGTWEAPTILPVA